MERCGYRGSHGLSRGGQGGLSSRFGSFGLLFCATLLAHFGHLGQLVVVQLRLDKRLEVARAQAFVVRLADGSEQLIQVLDSVAKCVQRRCVV